MTWKEIEKLHHKEDRGSYVRSESGTYDIIEAVNKLIDSHNTDSKSDYEKKQDGTWCDFCGKMHTGQCKKGDIDSDRKCCNQCRGGWSEIGNQFGCLKVDCSCHSVPAEKCSCLEDNKLSQAFCKVHGKNNSDRVDMTWKERFDEKFEEPDGSVGWVYFPKESVVSFIASEREILLKELIDEVKRRMWKEEGTLGNRMLVNKRNQGLVEVIGLIRNKMQI
jgi:hypothetical protein